MAVPSGRATRDRCPIATKREVSARVPRDAYVPICAAISPQQQMADCAAVELAGFCRGLPLTGGSPIFPNKKPLIAELRSADAVLLPIPVSFPRTGSTTDQRLGPPWRKSKQGVAPPGDAFFFVAK